MRKPPSLRAWVWRCRFRRRSQLATEWFDDEPAFDPERHLRLEEPEEVVMLADLGYDQAEIATKATPVAASSPFRILSDEGATVMLDVARRLRSFARPAGNRIERMSRGGCYRSRWLRDLCTSPDVSPTTWNVSMAQPSRPTRCRCTSATSTTNRRASTQPSTSGTTTLCRSTT